MFKKYCCLLLLAMLFCQAVVLNVFGESDNISYRTIPEKIEGDGFNTPEEAVTAYIDGLKNMDLDQMMRTCAVETYGENYNLAEKIEQVGLYDNSFRFVPNISELAIRLNIERRREDIIRFIYLHYLILTQAAEVTRYSNYLLNEFQTGEDFVNMMFPSDDREFLSNITFHESFIDPGRINDDYYSERIQTTLQNKANVINADEVRPLITLLSVENNRYILAMDTVKYDDRWYVLEGNGIAGVLLMDKIEMDAFTGGMALLQDDSILQ